MGQITTSVGLVSGIDTGAITDQLIEIDSQPKYKLEQKNATLTTKITAYQTVNAQMLAVKGAADDLALPTTFNATLANTSNESVITATTSKTAVPGNYSFVVKELVSSQQTVTKGFNDDDTALGLDTTFSYESADARIDSTTPLSVLNGGEGVERGIIRITDQTGNATFVDLSAAVTIDDVVEEINNTLEVNVTASISGDGLVITDTSGGTTHDLKIEDVGSKQTATSLGLNKTSTTGQIVGDQINTIGHETMLANINDGNGVGIKAGVSDFRIENSVGSVDINLDGANTIGDVVDKINSESEAAGLGVTASVADDGVSLVLTDTNGGGSGFSVTNLNESTAAESLGILGDDADGNGKIDGERLIASINSKLLKNVNGGAGLGLKTGQSPSALVMSSSLDLLNNGDGISTNGNTAGDIVVTDRDGDEYEIDLDGVNTIADLIQAVENGTGGAVTLEINGNKLVAIDDTGGSSEFKIASVGDGTAAEDLGLAFEIAGDSITGSDLNPMQTSTETGAGTIRIQNAAGTIVDVDLSNAESFSDVIDAINNSGAGVTAQVNSAGNGLEIVDESGGNDELVISDVTGAVAANLGLAGVHDEKVADSGNLQMQYISESTTLDDLGVTRGEFTITDSSGASATVDLTQGDEHTLGDVIREINSRGLDVEARINENGDGIELIDNGPGLVPIKVEDEGSSTASDLGIVGEASAAGKNLDGSFEKHVKIDPDDSLEDIADKLNDADLNMRATIVNDGAAGSPYRLSMTTREPGTEGAFVFDDGDADLGAFNLAEAQDAVVFYGDTELADALVVTSSSNTVKNLIPGVTVNLKSASMNPVQVTISQDDQAITQSVKGFVDSVNSLIDTINTYDTYNADNNEKGLLFNDSAINDVTSSLYNSIIHGNPEIPGRYHTLSQVGVTVGSGGKLRFDQDKFNEALETDRDAVVDLFTWRETEEVETGEKDEDGKPITEEVLVASGIGVELDELMKRLTDEETSPIDNAIKSLEAQIEMNEAKIEEWDEKLARKRDQYVREFTAMEKALAEMQTMTNSISQIQPISYDSGN
ncbi:flagellar filament capping protein FliD [Planctomycetota bacterium]|nr:flagellar filament capping protein FliD [Planctomycetota bacterium]